VKENIEGVAATYPRAGVAKSPAATPSIFLKKKKKFKNNF
jgi:hypothetical protein